MFEVQNKFIIKKQHCTDLPLFWHSKLFQSFIIPIINKGYMNCPRVAEKFH